MFDSRKAQKRVEIYSVGMTDDGFGGTKAVETLLSTRWASIDDVSQGPIQSESGIKDFNDVYKFTFRHDKNLIIDPKKHNLKYNGVKYSILSVKNDGHRKVSQTVIAKKFINT